MRVTASALARSSTTSKSHEPLEFRTSKVRRSLALGDMPDRIPERAELADLAIELLRFRQ